MSQAPSHPHHYLDHAATTTVLPEAPVGGSYTATVTVVDRVFEAASGTVGVRLELPNPDLRLPAGIHCRVRFTTP